MPPRNAGKEKATEDTEDDDILQAVVLADSFNSRFGPLTMDTPRCLLPVCNVPLLDWTLEALASGGVQHVYVFCSSHTTEIRKHIAGSPWTETMRIHVISSRTARSVGDAMREIDGKQILTSDFVLVSGDIVSNIRIEDVVRAHKDRRKVNKDAIMTTVVRAVGPRDRPRQGGDATVVVMNAETSQCVHYEYLTNDKTRFELPAEVIKSHTDLDMRIDLIDCGIDICTPDVPALFSENFDYQDLRRHFVKGVLTSDLLSKTIYCHVVQQGYAARVLNTKMYATISKDIISRRTFPLTPDQNHVIDQAYELRRGLVYMSKLNVKLSRTCEIGNNSVVGSSVDIRNDAHISSSVIGNHCVIGDRSVIKNSYIFPKTAIGSDCVIEESIIGEGARILDGTHVFRGCLIGKEVTLGPNAVLEKFQRVSKFPPRDRDEQDSWDDDEGSVAGSQTSGAVESSEGSVNSDMASVLGEESHAYLWPEQDAEADEDDEDDESKVNIRLGRLGDHGSDLDYDDSDLSDADTVGSDSMGSPLSMSSATSAGLASNIPSLALDSSAADFASECRQSLERAYEEGHTIDNAAIELKTLRMASNVPLKQVADQVVDFLVGKIVIVENPAGQRTEIAKVVKRWGPLLTSIGWDDPAETISELQLFCARHLKFQKIFGQIIAALYNEDIIEFGDLKKWYAKALGMKRSGLEEADPLAATLDDSMQQALRLIQQIHELEQDSDEEESDDEEEAPKPTLKSPVAKKASDDEEDGDSDDTESGTQGTTEDDDEGEATETEDEHEHPRSQGQP